MCACEQVGVCVHVSRCVCVTMGVSLFSHLIALPPSSLPPPSLLGALTMQALSIAVFSTGWGMGMVMGPAVGGAAQQKPSHLLVSRTGMLCMNL